ncbi:hypothetical protein [Microbispora sp. NPDC046933]|uniref:hypothetical protein n=1 Tax=Microbispora sp. NPDC046933 TaxID=3155618 RepID=UPI00340797C6
MRSIRRSLSVAAAAGAFAAGTLTGVFAAAPANAAVSECVNGANGFVDIPYNKTGTVAYSVDLGGGRKAQLHYGSISGVQRGWAIIRGTTKKGDKVWMDWTTTATNGGWLQCGPFTVQADGLTNTSAAQKTSSKDGYWFRACGQIVGGTTRCTPWW